MKAVSSRSGARLFDDRADGRVDGHLIVAAIAILQLRPACSKRASTLPMRR